MSIILLAFALAPYNQMETSNLSQTYVWQPNTTSLGNSEPIDDLLFAHGSLAGELQSLTIGPVQHCLARHLTTSLLLQFNYRS